MRSLGAHLVLGPLILIIAIIFKAFPPKTINRIYGYRTSMSMKSQDVWKEANRYSSNLLMLAAIATISFQIISYKIMRPSISIIASCIFLVFISVAAVLTTEKHLRKHFDEDGKRKIPIEQKKE